MSRCTRCGKDFPQDRYDGDALAELKKHRHLARDACCKECAKVAEGGDGKIRCTVCKKDLPEKDYDKMQ